MEIRDLIIYILENELEDEEVIKDNKIIGFLSFEEVASRLDIGVSSVETMIKIGILPVVKIGEKFYIPANSNFNNIKKG